MTPRFSAYVKLKTLSFNSLFEPGAEALDIIRRVADIFTNNAPWQTLNDAILGTVEGLLFKTIGLAENVTIDETYNTRPFWGIGEPANPIIVPNNYSASISISRLTLDTLSIREFTTMPDYWYNPGIQNFIHRTLGPTTGREFLDYPFYTFLYFSSIERMTNGSLVDNVLRPFTYRELYVFMPSDYSTRVTSGDTIIVTDVRGTGKLLNLREFIKDLAENIFGSLGG